MDESEGGHWSPRPMARFRRDARKAARASPAHRRLRAARPGRAANPRRARGRDRVDDPAVPHVPGEQAREVVPRGVEPEVAVLELNSGEAIEREVDQLHGPPAHAIGHECELRGLGGVPTRGARERRDVGCGAAVGSRARASSTRLVASCSWDLFMPSSRRLRGRPSFRLRRSSASAADRPGSLRSSASSASSHSTRGVASASTWGSRTVCVSA